jgi:hypothetical protein
MVRGCRPAVFTTWSDNIKELMKCAWDPVISERPSFLEISLVLKQEMIDCCEGDSGNSKSIATSVTFPDDCKTKEVGLSDDSDQNSSEDSKQH